MELQGQLLTVLTLTSRDTNGVGRLTKQFLRCAREISAETDWGFFLGAMMRRFRPHGRIKTIVEVVEVAGKGALSLFWAARAGLLDATPFPSRSRGSSHVPSVTSPSAP